VLPAARLALAQNLLVLASQEKGAAASGMIVKSSRVLVHPDPARTGLPVLRRLAVVKPPGLPANTATAS
jgi:hypothetical protein